ncbi:hypothetical protein C8R43DRAFT_1054076, partial [Mycena crocata]
MPDAERTRRKPTFNTLAREEAFRNPPKNGSTYNILNEFVAPHIESFNALFDDSGRGLISLGLEDIGERVVFDGDGKVDNRGWGNRMRIWIESANIGRPMVPEKDKHSTNRKVFPSEARERLTSYRGRMTIKLCWTDPHGQRHEMPKDCGLVPVMVRSVRCNIRDMSSADLVKKHEEPEEFGGYFVINGNERLIRYLIILPRRNHYAVQIRCVRPDQTAVTNTLHYLSNGSAMLRFSWRKQEYVIPIMLVLKALVGASDKEIFEGVMMQDYENTFLTDRVELLLRSFKMFTLSTGQQCLEYLGDKFRVVLGTPEDWTNAPLLVLAHLKTARDKYRMLLVFMLRKLYAVVSSSCCADNPDSPQHQEVLLPCSLYGMIIKERLEETLNQIRNSITTDVRNGVVVDFNDKKYFQKVLTKVNFDIGAKLSNFLATASGFTIVAEKLNWQRYISHFRCIHRGAFFAELKTTTVRKLLPEAWGFLCPVHTPDGSPCGLLIISPERATFTNSIDGRKNLCVQLDGRGINEVPLDLEIGLVPESIGGQYPGLFLFSTRARMMRPVYMDIACTPEEIEVAVSTHVEHNPTNFLSILANLTPFSDFNQVCDNFQAISLGLMYIHRQNNKLYRLQTGQSPVVRPALHNTYAMDSLPMNVVSRMGTVYKAQIIDLKDVPGAGQSATPTVHFGLGRDIPRYGDRAHYCLDFVDTDGLPFIGTKLSAGDPIAAYIDDTTGRTRFVKYKGDEMGLVDEVRLLDHITLRITRSPVIGDKFSSRHGQKGVCSQKWPTVDMPFSESGMQPDSMAGKAGSMHGLAQDATPFKFTEEDTAIEYFGDQLLAAGYNYYGMNPSDIYIGVFQVRTTGPVDPVTRQPVKGRKRAGGIRFGEMERDALIAHGTSFLLQDRLMNCSDYSTAWVCRTCGSLISLGYEDITLGEVAMGASSTLRPVWSRWRVLPCCRSAAEQQDEPPEADVKVAISSQHVLGRASKGGDLDIVALASMGIAVSLAVS